MNAEDVKRLEDLEFDFDQRIRQLSDARSRLWQVIRQSQRIYRGKTPAWNDEHAINQIAAPHLRNVSSKLKEIEDAAATMSELAFELARQAEDVVGEN